MKVLAIQSVLDYLRNLVPVLYEKEYFSYEDTAQKYIDDLSDCLLNILAAYCVVRFFANIFPGLKMSMS
jgi:hypothetical protein